MVPHAQVLHAQGLHAQGLHAQVHTERLWQSTGLAVCEDLGSSPGPRGFPDPFALPWNFLVLTVLPFLQGALDSHSR